MATSACGLQQWFRCPLHVSHGAKHIQPGTAGYASPFTRRPNSSIGSTSSSWKGARNIQLPLQKPFTTLRRRLGTFCVAEGSLRDQATQRAEANVPAEKEDESWLQKVARRIQEAQEPVEAIQALRESSATSLQILRMPTTRDEQWRFTDIRKILLTADVWPAPPHFPSVDVSQCTLPEADQTRVVLVDGVIAHSLSHLEGLLEGITVENLATSAARETAGQHLGTLAGQGQGGLDVFSALNGAAASDVLLVHVPDGKQLDKPLHIVYHSTGSGDGTTRLASPRLLVVAGKHAEVEIVEEFTGGGGAYWTNALAEFVLGEHSKVSHSYIQQQAKEGIHTKRTYVALGTKAEYRATETGWGGRLTRHNLHIQQLGPETVTDFATFYLAGRSQLHDLHSSLYLDHPRGRSNQLHKCIVTHATGHGVFDGNVRVNKLAQQTDASQLSRNLLLAPRATVNIKPNLQIIADDVKCTHGAAISDLEEDQLFYFQARGIDAATARSALVYSFGCEVTDRLNFEGLRTRVQDGIRQALISEGALASSL